MHPNVVSNIDAAKALSKLNVVAALLKEEASQFCMALNAYSFQSQLAVEKALAVCIARSGSPTKGTPSVRSALRYMVNPRIMRAPRPV